MHNLSKAKASTWDHRMCKLGTLSSQHLMFTRSPLVPPMFLLGLVLLLLL